MIDERGDEKFLEFVVKSLVDHPEEVKIDRVIDEMGVRLSLHVHPEDMGQIIGREGKTVTAIRSLLKIIGRKNHARVSLVIEEPEGGRQERTPGAVEKIVEDLKEDLG